MQFSGLLAALFASTAFAATVQLDERQKLSPAECTARYGSYTPYTGSCSTTSTFANKPQATFHLSTRLGLLTIRFLL